MNVVIESSPVKEATAEDHKSNEVMVKIKTLLMMMYDDGMLSQVADRLNITKAEEQLIFERMSSLAITVGDKEDISFDQILRERKKAQLIRVAEAIESFLNVDGFAEKLIFSEPPDKVRGMIDGFLLIFDATREFDHKYFKEISLMVADRWADQNKENETFGKMSLSDKEKLISSLRMMAGGDDKVNDFLLKLDQRLGSGALKNNWQKIIQDKKVRQLIAQVLTTLSNHEEEQTPAQLDNILDSRVKEWLVIKDSMNYLYAEIDELLADNLKEQVKNDVEKGTEQNIKHGFLQSDLEKIDSKIQGKDQILKEWHRVVREMIFERGKEFPTVVSLLEGEKVPSRLTEKSVRAMREMLTEAGWDHLNEEKDDLEFARKITELMQTSLDSNSSKPIFRKNSLY